MKSENWEDGFESDDRTDDEREEAVNFLRVELMTTINRCGHEADLTFDDLAITLQKLSLDAMEMNQTRLRQNGDEEDSED